MGISWVTKSKEKGERLPEDRFVVEVGEEDVFQKVITDALEMGRADGWQRRKSMEPKALALMESTGPTNRCE